LRLFISITEVTKKGDAHRLLKWMHRLNEWAMITKAKQADFRIAAFLPACGKPPD
jgi:hypothetical protein